MVTYATDETFARLVAKGPVMVDFFGKTCIPCKMVDRVMEGLLDEFPFINLVKVDVEECPKVSDEFEVDGIPDLYFYKDGRVVRHVVGSIGEDEIRTYLAEILY